MSSANPTFPLEGPAEVTVNLRLDMLTGAARSKVVASPALLSEVIGITVPSSKTTFPPVIQSFEFGRSYRSHHVPSSVSIYLSNSTRRELKRTCRMIRSTR